MSEVFIIQNQDKLFLSKQRAWVDGREPAGLYRTPHRDEAVNEKFEVNAKDYSQRVSLVSCALNERGVPLIDPDILPPPLPKAKGEDSMALELEPETVPEQAEGVETVSSEAPAGADQPTASVG
ncbi:hypothetical protein QWI17_22755 [Gilvimarinus sp. SDUM040013]|uniref:Uncharacterized protein n=1 Tax=Gilvimarinus gilvus TaxID=3058038 RepID=A0ABU4RXE5_9GAMM|nr:hypothetical protein [Gilvimarinus sp. SDUM040013]MDO3388685.1 hypothetical protein [Gilvimarinus sp. SDUM040013]MDX6849580.1 hypothetical protein [Gilvimarinus sp. SDUM040013]